MGIESTFLVTSPSPNSFKVFHLSSSPLPELDELVTNIPQALPKISPAAPSPRFAFEFSSENVGLSKSGKLIQESTLELSNYFRNSEVTNDYPDCELIDNHGNNKNASSKTCLNNGDRPKKYTKFDSLEIEDSSNINSGGVAEFKLPGEKVDRLRKAGLKKVEDIKVVSDLESRGKLDELGTKWKPEWKTAKAKVGKNTQAQLQKGKVTKPSVSLTTSSKIQKSVSLLENLSKEPYHDGHIDAVKRRLEWTPPKDTRITTITPPSKNIVDNSNSSDGSSKKVKNDKEFNGLFEDFAYIESPRSSCKNKKPKERVIGKRKLIELVKSSTTVSGKSKVKKVFKKKVRTLTELSTSVYVEDENPQPTTLLQYLQSQESKENATSKTNYSMESGSKAAVSTVKSVIDQTPKSTLLSPESALKLASKQDFVFGTSSQLTTEKSPTFVRELPGSIQSSNQFDDPFASSPVVPMTKRKNLWNAASRDSDRSFLNVDSVDLAISPSTADAIVSSPILSEDPFLKSNSSTFATNMPSSDQSKTASPLTTGSGQQPVNNDDVLILTCYPPEENSKTEMTATSRQKQSAKSLTQMTSKERPNFESYTNAQLAKEISAYHFKPIKKREQMITLLQKCWESKQAMISKASNNSTRINTLATCTEEFNSRHCETTSPPKIKKVGGKKGKISSSLETKIINEISESEICSSPSSQNQTPNNSRKKSNTPDPVSEAEAKINTPQIYSLSSSTQLSSPELSPTSSLRLVFSHITQAVKNMTPSKEPKNPNWYEKILLYDPIVIEDLTVWLNTGGLQKTDWGGKVDHKVVKKWCESKSICCVWRQNLRGRVRNGCW